MKCEIRDSGDHSYYLLFLLITLILAIKFFQFMEQIWFGDCLLCVRIKGTKIWKE